MSVTRLMFYKKQELLIHLSQASDRLGQKYGGSFDEIFSEKKNQNKKQNKKRRGHKQNKNMFISAWTP
jgi:hypothetical protein